MTLMSSAIRTDGSKPAFPPPSCHGHCHNLEPAVTSTFRGDVDADASPGRDFESSLCPAPTLATVPDIYGQKFAEPSAILWRLLEVGTSRSHKFLSSPTDSPIVPISEHGRTSTRRHHSRPGRRPPAWCPEWRRPRFRVGLNFCVPDIQVLPLNLYFRGCSIPFRQPPRRVPSVANETIRAPVLITVGQSQGERRIAHEAVGF